MFGTNPQQIANCYLALARMNDAGLPMDTNLESLRGVLDEHDQAALARMIQRIRKGAFLARAMEIEQMAPLDVALMKVAEKTGNFSEISKFLAEFYMSRAAMERTMRRALVKPFLLFLGSLFLRNFPQLFSGEVTVKAYLLQSFGVLSAVVAVAAGVFYLYRISYRSRSVAEAWHKAVEPVPWFGGVLRAIGKERFFTCLLMGLKSGCDLSTMVEIAREMTFLPKLRDACGAIARDSQKTGFATAISNARICTPNELLALRTGEAAGSLDESLGRVVDDLRIEIAGALRAIEEWLPRVIYAAALAYVVTGIFKSFSDQLKTLDKLFESV